MIAGPSPVAERHPGAVRLARSWAISCALVMMAPAGHGASLEVRDAVGNQWRAVSDPSDDAQGYVLEHLGTDGRLDARFGRGGRRPLSISATDDAPAAIRVDVRGRIWATGASIAGGQPQAVVRRYLPDGAPDLLWGVQGKVSAGPGGLAIKPNDLLPLSDGSVLVAGVAANVDPPRAVIFHLKADGSLDLSFGVAGTWQRAGETDGSTATNLAASESGEVAVCVAARGEHPVAEIWSLSRTATKLLLQQAMDTNNDGEDLRVVSSFGRWAFGSGNAPTPAGLRASLELPSAMPEAARIAAASASADPGQAGFSPFEPDPQSSSATSSESDRSDTSTGPLAIASWAAAVAAIAAACAAGMRARKRSGQRVLRQRKA